MRISARPSDSTYHPIALWASATLNGVKQEYAFAADSAEGWVERYMVVDGQLTGYTERVHGVVEIVIPDGHEELLRAFPLPGAPA